MSDRIIQISSAVAMLALASLSWADAGAAWPTPSDATLAEIRSLLHDGSDAAALKAATDALVTAPQPMPPDINDAKIAQLCDLAAVCNLRAGTPLAAQRYARLAVTAPHVTREMKLNLASAELQMPVSQMHAVKSLAELCVSHPADETALSLFGHALDNAGQNAANAKLLQPFDAQHAALVNEFQKSHPGQRLWGDTWVSRDKYIKLNEKRKDALDHVADLKLKVQKKKELVEAHSETHDNDDGKKTKHRKANGERSTNADNLQGTVAAEKDLRDLRHELEKATAEVPVVPWTVSLRGLLEDQLPAGAGH